jgi:hypothetical protein
VSRDQLIEAVAGHLHAGQRIEGARLVAAQTKAKAQIDGEDVALEYLNSLLYFCLNNDRYAQAAQMLWTPNLFNSGSRFTKAVWDEMSASSSLMLMGAASTSKSYSGGAWLFLDWLRDPEYTSVNLVGPSENHLKDNLFTHLVTLHSQASLPLPGIVGDLFIGLNPKQRKSAITGIVIPIGKRPAGRLQGRKRVPRRVPHPYLGGLSRIRFFIDEAEKVPVGVFLDIDNVFANLDTDIDGFKIILAFNPEDPAGQVAQRCEPEKGWEAFDMEADERWTSKRGWRVLRLDAAKCENVVQKKLIFPGLQTHEGYQRIIKNAGGTDTPGYYTMGRACFPRAGAIYSVVPTLLVSRLKGEYIFAEDPETFGAVDLALEGNDTAQMTVGRFGKAVGIRTPPSVDFPKGRETLFQDKEGKRKFRWGLQVDQIFALPRGGTVKMAEEVKDNAVRLRIPPNNLMLDRTGNGAGVHDLLKSIWSEEVRGLNYTEAATERKIIAEDTKTAKETYIRVVSELWFAFKAWAEFNFVKVKEVALDGELVQELTGRRYDAAKQNRVESKLDYKSRGNPSPNKADAVTLLLHCVRLASGIVPSATDDMAGVNYHSKEDSRGPVPFVVDESNKFDDIDKQEPEFWMT